MAKAAAMTRVFQVGDAEAAVIRPGGQTAHPDGGQQAEEEENEADHELKDGTDKVRTGDLK